MRHSFNLQLLATAGLVAPFASAHLSVYTDGMYCPGNTYTGPLTNMTDPNLSVFDPLFNLTADSWFLSKGRNCLLAEPTGVWEFAANSVVSVPWANWQNSTGFYADGKEQDQRPIPYSVTNPEVAAEGLETSSKGLAAPNMHCANKSTAAGTGIAVAYKTNIWEVTMEDFVVVSIAPETPFERLANYTIPNLASCEKCICATIWVPGGYGQQNMYMAAHTCTITNPNGGQVPKTPSLVPGPGVVGPKQMIAAFQLDGNNVNYKPGDKVPTYSTSMGYMNGAQTDIFSYPSNSTIPSGSASVPASSASVHSSSASVQASSASTHATAATASSIAPPFQSTASLSAPGCPASK